MENEHGTWRALASRLDLSMTVVLELCVEKRLSDAEK
jgi:hypothetical protein